MKEKMKRICDAFHKYNSENMAELVFGLSKDECYDALVVAPAYTPYKLKMDQYCKVTTLKEGAYIGGYLVEKGNHKIAWIKTASSASNLIDHLCVCAELSFKKMIFVGAVGALVPEFKLGDICTPRYSISGVLANTYLKDSIYDYVPFERIEPDTNYIDKVIEKLSEDMFTLKKASVYCTDSVALEYYHLDEIKSFGTELIEMETSSFYLMADLLEIPSIALLVVSDNSATGVALVGRNEEEKIAYDEGRKKILPEMLLKVVGY